MWPKLRPCMQVRSAVKCGAPRVPCPSTTWVPSVHQPGRVRAGVISARTRMDLGWSPVSTCQARPHACLLPAPPQPGSRRGASSWGIVVGHGTCPHGAPLSGKVPTKQLPHTLSHHRTQALYFPGTSRASDPLHSVLPGSPAADGRCGGGGLPSLPNFGSPFFTQ